MKLAYRRANQNFNHNHNQGGKHEISKIPQSVEEIRSLE